VTRLKKHNIQPAYFVIPIVLVAAISTVLIITYIHRDEAGSLADRFGLNRTYYDDTEDTSADPNETPTEQQPEVTETTIPEGEVTDTATDEEYDTESYEQVGSAEESSVTPAVSQTSSDSSASVSSSNTEQTINTFADPQLFADQVFAFRRLYETALNEGTYDYIAPYIMPGSQAEGELYDFVNDMYGKDFNYHFIRTEIMDVTLIDGGALVDTFEIFDFTDAEGQETHYERFKTYVMEIDEQLDIKVSAIDITDTEKQ